MIELLDVGGEGRLRQAINLNTSYIKTLGPNKGEPIPRLMIGRADDIPLPCESVRVVVMERTPLMRHTALEIHRVVVPGGFVILRHHAGITDPHSAAAQILGTPLSTTSMKIGSQAVKQSVFRKRTHREPGKLFHS